MHQRWVPASRRRFAGLHCCLKIPRPLLRLISAGLRTCSPLLCEVINSLPSVKHFEDEMRYMSAKDYWVYVSCLQVPGLEVQELKAGLGDPALCLLPCLRQHGQPFSKVWKEFAKPQNPQIRLPARVSALLRGSAGCTAPGRIRPLFISFPLPSSA